MGIRFFQFVMMGLAGLIFLTMLIRSRMEDLNILLIVRTGFLRKITFLRKVRRRLRKIGRFIMLFRNCLRIWLMKILNQKLYICFSSD